MGSTVLTMGDSWLPPPPLRGFLGTSSRLGEGGGEVSSSLLSLLPGLSSVFQMKRIEDASVCFPCLPSSWCGGSGRVGASSRDVTGAELATGKLCAGLRLPQTEFRRFFFLPYPPISKKKSLIPVETFGGE